MFKEVGENCDSPLSRGKNEEKKEKEARSIVQIDLSRRIYFLVAQFANRENRRDLEELRKKGDSRESLHI